MNYKNKPRAEQTPEERYNATLLGLCQTQIMLLKHRVGQLEEMPLEERLHFQKFCDCTALCFYSFLNGTPEQAALDDFMAKFSPDEVIREGRAKARAKK